ncbi:hypothetical protein RJ641_023931 [Dillenia turbinata]|uniref:Uncharacterized protein n=1 Tax=Dillenia turbinata TaxID=194707 RepID=A0AAN8YW40_9MAGN
MSLGKNMLSRWSRLVTNLSQVGSFKNSVVRNELLVNYSKVAVAAEPIVNDSTEKGFSNRSEVNLNKAFWTKPCSLALAPGSPLRIEEPKFEGVTRFILKLLLFYSKQSKSIRGANVVYHRIVSQVDKPAIYNVLLSMD